MGKKYIIEIGRLERLYKAFVGAHGKPEITWLSPEVDLTPYTEPDLDAIRKEAYEQGRKDGKIEGQAETWVCVKKIAFKPEIAECIDDLVRIGFDVGTADSWSEAIELLFEKYSATEAIEKIRQYEQKQEEKITKGDIIRIKSTPEIEILVTYADEEYISGIAMTEVDDNCEIGDQYTNIRISNVENTGRHYEIADVLRKMRETE